MKQETDARQKARPKLKTCLLIAAGFTAIALGLFLRIQNANTRILHSDEAVQAYQLWELMKDGHYKYDPVDKHGPLLYYLSTMLNKALGIDASELNQANVRLLPIVCSILLTCLILFSQRTIDWTAILAGTLFAISPLPVVYGAYYTQESLFALLGILSLYSFNKYLKSPTSFNCARFALSMGALFATKETALIHILPIFVATVAIQEKPFAFKDWLGKRAWKPIVTGLAVFAFVWVFSFSAAFSNFDQLGDSFKAFVHYTDRAQGQGHEKPFYYYLSLFWPKIVEGTHWGEPLFLVLAAMGIALLACSKAQSNRHIKLSVLYGFACFILYSIIPYKTPWLILSSYISFCYSAAFALQWLGRRASTRWTRSLVLSAIVLTCWRQYHSTQLANRYASDSRNPYIYQHTSPQFKRLVQRIEELERLDPNTPLTIAVGGKEHAWPLPWYLKDNDTVGYWKDPSEMPALDLVIAPIGSGSLPKKLKTSHTVEYHGLRKNIILELWIHNDQWEAFMEKRNATSEENKTPSPHG